MPVYTYTTLDDPLALATGSTSAQGINASGQIVGFYQNAGGFHGFLYSGGTYTTLDDPSATNGTLAQGIIVARYHGASGPHGFHLPISLHPAPPLGTHPPLHLPGRPRPPPP